MRVDVTKSADVHALVRKAVAQYGGLDFAFNNAGLVGSVAGIVETAEEDWNRVVATNLTGVWGCMKYEIPEMLKRGRGAIVNRLQTRRIRSHQIGGAAIGNPGNPRERCGSRAGADAHGRANNNASP